MLPHSQRTVPREYPIRPVDFGLRNLAAVRVSKRSVEIARKVMVITLCL